MMNFAKYIIIIFLICNFNSGYTQEIDREFSEGRKPTSKALQKLRWDMSLGTAYTFMPGYGGGMSYYATPGFSYPINNRFSFHGGIMAGVYTSPGFVSPESGSQKVTSGFTSIYGSMAYHLNPNVIIYGTGIKSISTPGGFSPFYAPSYDEISFGSSIRLSNNVTIGASVHFREYSPFGGGYTSPFFK
ncbi:MAG: hypothetical protein IH594_19625 [Bacteroidales bacterium]|nr:hypothetical protein [Bacteroidales bacterium]